MRCFNESQQALHCIALHCIALHCIEIDLSTEISVRLSLSRYTYSLWRGRWAVMFRNKIVTVKGSRLFLKTKMYQLAIFISRRSIKLHEIIYIYILIKYDTVFLIHLKATHLMSFCLKSTHLMSFYLKSTILNTCLPDRLSQLIIWPYYFSVMQQVDWQLEND